MEVTPHVSVLCAAYNHEKYIRQTLESIVSQKTDFPFEVIVHDDASTDGTTAIIREFEKNYPHVIKPTYQTENQYSKRSSITLNHMLPKARGKYIAFCEGDDYWTDESKLQRQYEYMQANADCPLVAHETMRIFEDGRYMSRFSSHDFSAPDACFLSADEVIGGVNDFHTSSLFIRREFFERNMDFLKTVPALDYVIKIVCATDMTGKVYVIPRVMSAYRMSAEGSWSRRIRDDATKYRQHVERSIDVLRRIDAYREFRFTQAMWKEITKRQFDIALVSGDRKAWKDPQYRAYLAGVSKKQRMAAWLQLHFPRLFRWAQKSYAHIKKFIEG